MGKRQSTPGRLFLPREIVIRTGRRVRTVRAAGALALCLAALLAFAGLWTALAYGLAGNPFSRFAGPSPLDDETAAFDQLVGAVARAVQQPSLARGGAIAERLDALVGALAAERGRAAYGQWMVGETANAAEAERVSQMAMAASLGAAVGEARLRLLAADRQKAVQIDVGAALGESLRGVRSGLQAAAAHRALLVETLASLQADRAAAARLAGFLRLGHPGLRARIGQLEGERQRLRAAEAELTRTLSSARRALAKAAGPWAMKQASRQGVELIDYLFPLHVLPDGTGPEPALILAVIRQESRFGAAAVSTAGASGLMQLMPDTAAHVARSLNLGVDAAKLMQDPELNVQLGRAYLDQLLRRFRGSYVLAVAAYNAGPARVDDWISRFGDPRRAEVDAETWIASIPFRETRAYVRNVLLSLGVYRQRLAPGPDAAPLQTAATQTAR